MSSSANNKQALPHKTLKLAISQMQFKSVKFINYPLNSQTIYNRLQIHHSASKQNFHKEYLYRSDKQKRVLRLKDQRYAFNSEQNKLESGQSQIFRNWHKTFLHSQRSVPTERITINELQIIKSQMSQQLAANNLEKSPIKSQTSIRKRKYESAKRDVRFFPAELLTRKLQWDYNSSRQVSPFKLKPQTSPNKPIIKLQQVDKHALIRLSGWELENSRDYAAHQLPL